MLNLKKILLITLSVSLIAATSFAHSHHEYEVEISVSEGNLFIYDASQNIPLEYDDLSGHFVSDFIDWESLVPLSTMQQEKPDWRIEIERISFDSGLYALDADFGFQLVLAPDNHLIGDPVWDDDEGWHFHRHLVFGVPDAYIGEEFSAIMRLVDAGGVYGASDPFELTFVAVPEPVSMLYLLGGSLVLIKKKLRS